MVNMRASQRYVASHDTLAEDSLMKSLRANEISWCGDKKQSLVGNMEVVRSGDLKEPLLGSNTTRSIVVIVVVATAVVHFHGRLYLHF